MQIIFGRWGDLISDIEYLTLKNVQQQWDEWTLSYSSAASSGSSLLLQVSFFDWLGLLKVMVVGALFFFFFAC